MRWKTEKHNSRWMLSSHLENKSTEILVSSQKHRAQLNRNLQNLFVHKSESKFLNESHRMAPHSEHGRHIRGHVFVG